MPNTKQDTKRNLTARQRKAAENIRHFWFMKKKAERITQVEFSKQMGWSHSIFGQYLNGRVACGPSALYKIAEGLGCTPYDLDEQLRGEFTPPPEDMHDFRASLLKLPAVEKTRAIILMARSLPEEDLLQIMEDTINVIQTKREVRHEVRK